MLAVCQLCTLVCTTSALRAAPVEAGLQKSVACREMMKGWLSLRRMHTSRSTFLVRSGLLSTLGTRLSATCTYRPETSAWGLPCTSLSWTALAVVCAAVRRNPPACAVRAPPPG